MSDDNQPQDDNLEYTAEEEEREIALAARISELIGGNQANVILNAMTRVTAAVLSSVRQSPLPDSPMTEASLFAGVVVNLHALVHPDPAESIAGTLALGDAAVLTPAQLEEATILCPPLAHLMVGLRLHYDARHVANSWTSVLLNLLLEDGPEGEPGLERAQGILRSIVDSLPAAVAQMRAMRAIDEGGNTGQVGRA